MTTPTTRSDLRLPSSDPELVLEGTLERPEAPPRGLVLLLSGSGPQDRDETVSGQRPFARLRSGLASRGWAVFSWDDRGVGESEGDYQAANPGALVSDVLAVRAGVLAVTGPLPTVYAGHSQGTFIATMTAVEAPAPEALILLAGSGHPGLDTLILQHQRISEAEGLPADWAEAALAMKRLVFERLADTPPDATGDALEQLRSDVEEIVRDWVVEPEEVELFVEDLMEWEWRFIVQHDPAPWLARVPCPTLVVAGALDTQVDGPADVEATRVALAAGCCPEVEAEVVPGLNHLFQPCESGALSDYETAGEPFPDALLDRISAWLAARIS